MIQRNLGSPPFLCVAIAVMCAAGCSTSQPPPIVFAPTRSEWLTEVVAGSFAIHEGSFVAPEGFQVLPDSGFPPKLGPASGKLLVAFGNVNPKVRSVGAERIELRRDETSLAELAGVMDPRFHADQPTDLNQQIEALFDKQETREMGFVFIVPDAEDANNLALKIHWRGEGDRPGSATIPIPAATPAPTLPAAQ